jgi:hypothetical protein
MPHLRLEVPEEWLEPGFAASGGFDPRELFDHLVEVVTSLKMPNPASDDPPEVPLINRKNLKHALIPVRHSGVAGDRSKKFLHLTFSAGNDTPGRTAEVRRRAAETLGEAIDAWVGEREDLGSVTVQMLDIDRKRGYTTTPERRRKREAGSG